MPKRSRRRKRQAEDGKTVEMGLMVYEHWADTVDDVAAEVEEGVRNMVFYALEPTTALAALSSGLTIPNERLILNSIGRNRLSRRVAQPELLLL